MARRSDSAPTTSSAVIDLLARRNLLGRLGIEPSHARTMKARDAIPGHWMFPIATVARQARLPISVELMARLAASKNPLTRKWVAGS